MDLIPLRVKIGLKRDRRNGNVHAYPDFNQLSAVQQSGLDWSAYIDQFGGWHYDSVAGHIDDDPTNDSPRGVWLGMLLVPEAFANAAVELFPDQCQILTEQQAERFYEDRVTVDQPENHEDVEALQAIAARLTIEKELGITPSNEEKQRRRDALDPTKKQRGLTKNEMKRWTDYKAKRGLTIKDRPSS